MAVVTSKSSANLLNVPVEIRHQLYETLLSLPCTVISFTDGRDCFDQALYKTFAIRPFKSNTKEANPSSLTAELLTRDYNLSLVISSPQATEAFETTSLQKYKPLWSRLLWWICRNRSGTKQQAKVCTGYLSKKQRQMFLAD